MKTGLLALLSCLLSSGAFAQVRPSQVPAPVSSVFVPLGFDDNDQAELVVYGLFPNSCMKKGLTSAVVDEVNTTIYVTSNAWLFPPNGVCELRGLTSEFTVPVALGILNAGTYKLVVNGSEQFLPEGFEIAPSNSTHVDDYFYAPVDRVQAAFNAEVDAFEISVFGELPSHENTELCYALPEVKAFPAGKNTIVVLPILQEVPAHQCNLTEGLSYVRKTYVSKHIAGKNLIHVRTTNGQSVNKVFDFKRSGGQADPLPN